MAFIVVIKERETDPCDPGIPLHVEEGFATKDAAEKYAAACESDGSVDAVVLEQVKLA